jgi:hypothetical protein
MVCKNCDGEVRAGDKFCAKCRAPQYGMADDVSGSGGEYGDSVTSNQKSRLTNVLHQKHEQILTDLNRHVKLSYRDAMKYFIDHKGDNPGIAKGAMVLETIKSGYQIYEVFLDRNNELVEDKHGCPLGFKQKIESLDDELSDLFRNTNVIIVE